MTALSSSLLQALRPYLQASAWRVAFSGGLDSTVLLHLLAELRQQQNIPALMAVHVHHGLQPAAEAWPAHCAAVCQALAIPLQVCRVRVVPGASQEAAARTARYAALAGLLAPGDVLLTAQHADDQAETLLFRLLRGAGVRGLAAMPSERALGTGRLVRPLLGCSRAELEIFAREAGLSWIDDPSNQSLLHARNYLRHRLMPPLLARWPQARISLCRTAGQMAETQQLLEELARQDLQGTCPLDCPDWLDLPALDLPALQGLTEARQRNLLRCWLASFGPAADYRHWQGWQALRDAAPEAEPCWRVAGGQLRRAGRTLYFLPEGDWSISPMPGQRLVWADPGRPLRLPGNGLLWLSGPAAGQDSLEIRYRQGGERLQLAGRGRRDLKRLLQEAGIPAFVRGRLPLLYAAGQLVAVANLPGYSRAGWSLVWQPPRFEVKKPFR